MFSNLTKGSIIYGLETKGSIRPFTALITNVSLPRPVFNNISFTFYVTVVATEPTGILKVLLDSNNESIFTRDDLGVGAGTPAYYVDIVSSVSKHETLITEYSEAYSYFNPEFANKMDDKTATELRGEIKDIKSQIGEIFAFIKGGNINKPE